MTHSALETSGQRFLSLILQQALSDAWLTPEDFTAAFSPESVMRALEKAPDLRARLLIQAAGVHERIAPKKSTTAAAEDLQIALSEGVCTPSLLVELFGMDDRVRYSSNDELWALLTRDNFWTQQSERARTRMHAVVTAALEQGLIQLSDVVDAVTPARLSSDLPKPLLERVLTRAIERGRAGVVFDAESVFDVLPLEDWVTHVPLALIWEALVLERVLPAAGVVTLAPRQPAAPGTSGSGGGAGAVDDVKPLHPAGESEARERAIANLKRLDRLPPRVDTLPSPTLLAIDGMYAELLSTPDEEERAQAIRDAFPNAAMLEEALFAVAEALDPRLNAETLRARGAEGESLITLVLFEERRRSSGRASIPPGRSPSRPPGPVTSPTPPPVVEAHAPPPPLPAVKTSKLPSVPPPLPPAGQRSLAPPPLPGQGARGRAR